MDFTRGVNYSEKISYPFKEEIPQKSLKIPKNPQNPNKSQKMPNSVHPSKELDQEHFGWQEMKIYDFGLILEILSQNWSNLAWNHV